MALLEKATRREPPCHTPHVGWSQGRLRPHTQGLSDVGPDPGLWEQQDRGWPLNRPVVRIVCRVEQRRRCYPERSPLPLSIGSTIGVARGHGESLSHRQEESFRGQPEGGRVVGHFLAKRSSENLEEASGASFPPEPMRTDQEMAKDSRTRGLMGVASRGDAKCISVGWTASGQDEVWSARRTGGGEDAKCSLGRSCVESCRQEVFRLGWDFEIFLFGSGT